MPITKHNVVVTKAEDIARTIREAFLIASSGRPGPVACRYHQRRATSFRGIQLGSVGAKTSAQAHFVTITIKRNSIRAVEMLNTAKAHSFPRARIMVSGAMRAFEQFVRAGNYPVAMTLSASAASLPNEPLTLA